MTARTGAEDAAATFTSCNPATGAVVGEHSVASTDEVRTAVARAREGAAWWSALGWAERRRVLLAWNGLLVRRMAELAETVRAETGKPVADAALEIIPTIEHLGWAARHTRSVLAPRRVSSGLLSLNQASTLEYQPFGVVGVIGPWNYPVFTPMGSIAYALAAGNAVVFKPSEHTPGVGVWLARTFAEVVPEHPVFQVVTGFGETGAALTEAGVDKLAFTGSPETAKRVMATCAETLTPLVAECGGKDALIVDADADLAAAADAAVWGGMSNAGQTCVGVERVYVVDEVHDEFVRRVADLARRLRPGADGGADYGPMTMPGQLETVREHVGEALRRGARAAVGGTNSIRAPYVDPVVLTEVPEDAAALTRETFGPTLTVTRVRDRDEAVSKANASRYGLAAAVFTGNRRRGMQIARRLRSGMVSVNSVISFVGIPSLPWGGVGGSGFGRIQGADGLREFARAKAITCQRFRLPIEPKTFFRAPRALDLLVKLVRLRHGPRRVGSRAGPAQSA